MGKLANTRKLSVCVVGGPADGVGELLLDSLLKAIIPLCSRIYVITSNFPRRYAGNVEIIEAKGFEGEAKTQSLLYRILRFFIVQVKYSLVLLRISRDVDIVLFHLGEYMNILPLLCSKLIRKKSAIFHLGGDKILQERVDELSSVGKHFVPFLAFILVNIAYSLTNVVVCESERILPFGRLEKYRNKICITGGRYLDLDFFSMKKDPAGRENLVGYLGKLWPFKGVLNLVRSMPLVLSRRRDLRFVIIGAGYLRDEIENEIKKNGLEDRVTLEGWIPREKVPFYLNEMKLLVLPSYTEGMPGVVQEAMSCGAVVLATPVGAIPDLIRDGDTGFLLENNSPECIARNIIRALDHPHLERIARAARALIEKEYSYRTVVGRYRNMLQLLSEERLQ